MIYNKPRFITCGDKAILVEFGDSIEPRINRRVHFLRQAICKTEITGVIEVIPAYSSLLIYYEPSIISSLKIRKILHDLSELAEESESPKPRYIEIPVVYGGEYGPDIEYVASSNNLSVKEVVHVHSGTPYLVYMLGFLPGFPYLGGMSHRIAAPRLETPRIRIPAGSVGIAETQTGIYPTASPGGWRIIGRTPLRLFDIHNRPPALLQAGDYLTFVSITTEEFNRIQTVVDRGSYNVK